MKHWFKKAHFGTKWHVLNMPSIIDFILKSIDEDKTNTVKQIKDLIFNEFKTKISVQLSYNILKKITMFIKNLNLIIIHIRVNEQVNQF